MVLTLNKQKTNLFDKFRRKPLKLVLIASCAVHPPSRLFLEGAENIESVKASKKTSTSEHVIVKIAIRQASGAVIDQSPGLTLTTSRRREVINGQKESAERVALDSWIKCELNSDDKGENVVASSNQFLSIATRRHKLFIQSFRFTIFSFEFTFLSHSWNCAA